MDVIPIFVLVVFMATFLGVIIFLERNETKKLIKKEKKIIYAYKSGAFGNLPGNAKTVTTIKKQKSDMAKCPYCGGLFDYKKGPCPSCGASAKEVGEELVITKVEEHQEILRALEYQHEEKLKELSEKASQDKRDNFWAPMIIFAMLIMMVLGILSIVIK